MAEPGIEDYFVGDDKWYNQSSTRDPISDDASSSGHHVASSDTQIVSTVPSDEDTGLIQLNCAQPPVSPLPPEPVYEVNGGASLSPVVTAELPSTAGSSTDSLAYTGTGIDIASLPALPDRGGNTYTEREEVNVMPTGVATGVGTLPLYNMPAPSPTARLGPRVDVSAYSSSITQSAHMAQYSISKSGVIHAAPIAPPPPHTSQYVSSHIVGQSTRVAPPHHITYSTLGSSYTIMGCTLPCCTNSTSMTSISAPPTHSGFSHGVTTSRVSNQVARKAAKKGNGGKKGRPAAEPSEPPLPTEQIVQRAAAVAEAATAKALSALSLSNIRHSTAPSYTPARIPMTAGSSLPASSFRPPSKMPISSTVPSASPLPLVSHSSVAPSGAVTGTTSSRESSAKVGVTALPQAIPSPIPPGAIKPNGSTPLLNQVTFPVTNTSSSSFASSSSSVSGSGNLLQGTSLASSSSYTPALISSSSSSPFFVPSCEAKSGDNDRRELTVPTSFSSASDTDIDTRHASTVVASSSSCSSSTVDTVRPSVMLSVVPSTASISASIASSVATGSTSSATSSSVSAAIPSTGALIPSSTLSTSSSISSACFPSSSPSSSTAKAVEDSGTVSLISAASSSSSISSVASVVEDRRSASSLPLSICSSSSTDIVGANCTQVAGSSSSALSSKTSATVPDVPPNSSSESDVAVASVSRGRKRKPETAPKNQKEKPGPKPKPARHVVAIGISLTRKRKRNRANPKTASSADTRVETTEAVGLLEDTDPEISSTVSAAPSPTTIENDSKHMLAAASSSSLSASTADTISLKSAEPASHSSSAMVSELPLIGADASKRSPKPGRKKGTAKPAKKLKRHEVTAGLSNRRKRAKWTRIKGSARKPPMDESAKSAETVTEAKVPVSVVSSAEVTNPTPALSAVTTFTAASSESSLAVKTGFIVAVKPACKSGCEDKKITSLDCENKGASCPFSQVANGHEDSLCCGSDVMKIWTDTVQREKPNSLSRHQCVSILHKREEIISLAHYVYAISMIRDEKEMDAKSPTAITSKTVKQWFSSVLLLDESDWQKKALKRWRKSYLWFPDLPYFIGINHFEYVDAVRDVARLLATMLGLDINPSS